MDWHRVLVEGLDDWVPLLSVEGLVRRERPDASDAQVKESVRDAVTFLVTRGLVEMGAVSDGGFWPAEATIQAQLTQLDAELTSPDSNCWGFALWLNNTRAGDSWGRAPASPRGQVSRVKTSDDAAVLALTRDLTKVTFERGLWTAVNETYALLIDEYEEEEIAVSDLPGVGAVIAAFARTSVEGASMQEELADLRTFLHHAHSRAVSVWVIL